MKIIINAAIMSDKIINLLSEYKENGVGFTFIRKSGLKLEFEVYGITGEAACNLAKKLIKDTDFGKVLFFNVVEG